MIRYKVIVPKIQDKIKEFNSKSVGGGSDAGFYASSATKLQYALDRLTGIGEANASQQDLISAWGVYREANQKEKLNKCAKNGFYILGGVFLFGYLTSNIVHSFRKTNS